jgi:chaperonin GroES
MLPLETTFTLPEILASDNLAEHLSSNDLTTLGHDVVKSFEDDKTSRQDWEKRTEESMKLALQVMEEKSFPWPNASNVKFPLITIAALQYHARAYPALISGTQIVKSRVLGEDKDGTARSRASRIERHMSYQVLEEDENWEDQMDKVLITQPIVGCAFKKTYYDPIKKHNVSENVLAKDLVVTYYTKSLETAPRISHVLYLSKNDIYTRVVNGSYCDVDLLNPTQVSTDSLQLAQDKAQGVSPLARDDDQPYEIIEQHRSIDLDGDGYAEPYVVTVDRQSKQVLRLVARFFSSGVQFKGNTILSIQGENYFTKFPMIPSPDGGFYDLGFGSLLGPLNESINTLINQLIDSGTMSNTGGGFLARGIKVRGGTMGFTPGEWKPLDTTGDDLRKGIMPLPVREPSQVLFTLLSLLINYGERIGGAVDILVGQNPGQNTPAETSRTMAEQGMKIFSGIFKRTYRSLKDEFRKQYRLNQLYMVDKVDLGDLEISPDDYNGSSKDIRPAADPNMISDSQRMVQAQMLQQRANPMLGYNMRETELILLRSWKIPEEDIVRVLPDPKGPDAVKPPTPPKIQEAQVKVEGKLKEVQIKAQIESGKLQLASQLNQAKIDKLQAESLKILEEADTVQAKMQIAAIDAQIGMARQHQEHLLKTVALLHEMSMAEKDSNNGSDSSGME